MKSLILALLFLAGIVAFAQDADVPADVRNAFELKYPDAEEVEWKLRKDTYQAEFFDFYQTIVVYNIEGLWLRTISLVSEDDLPEEAYNFIDENYEISQIFEIHKVEDNKQKISYKVMIEDGGEKTTLKFSEEGTQIK